jgi:hypothetical protein
MAMALHALLRIMDFDQLDPETQRVRRRILESTCQEQWEPGSSKTFGDAPISAMTPFAVSVLRDRKKGLPEAQRARLKAMARVFDWAMRPESSVAGVTANPAKLVRRPKENVDGGYHSWTPEEVAQFERTRSAPALPCRLPCSCSRSAEVGSVVFGRSTSWGHASSGKNRHRRPVKLVPILPVLQIIDARRVTDFLVTDSASRSVVGLRRKVRAWCDEAGLRHCTAHDLLGGSRTQRATPISSWHLWVEDVEGSERYTKAADQKRIAAARCFAVARSDRTDR